MDPKSHWESIYSSKKASEVSWFQREATLSLRLIRSVAPKTASILDVGGGASTLVDGLRKEGYRSVTVLDISPSALRQARERLGDEAAGVRWIEADVLSPSSDIPPGSIDFWHDRAVFHFLTSPADRERYIAQVRRYVRPGGYVLVATFAEDGPTRCSRLDVSRYSASELHGEFGAAFRLRESLRQQHRTPSGKAQAFTYCLCRFEPVALERAAA